MLGELGLGTTRLAAHWTAECSQAGVQFYVRNTVLFQSIRPLECFATVITQVGTLVVMHVVHVTDVVLLTTSLVRTLTNKTLLQYLHPTVQSRFFYAEFEKKFVMSVYKQQCPNC
jgi:hypothetical protein